VGLFLATSVFAQPITVNGNLTAYNTFPLQNIEVISKKSKSIVKSDSLGQFSIKCYMSDIIKIKSKGFRPVTRKVEYDTESLSINLVFINSKKNREAVIANGNISESDLFYAIEHLEQENNDFCQYSDILELIRDLYPTDLEVRGDRVYFIGENKEVWFYVDDYTRSNNYLFIEPCSIKSIRLRNSKYYSSGGWRGIVIETKKYE